MPGLKWRCTVSGHDNPSSHEETKALCGSMLPRRPLVSPVASGYITGPEIGGEHFIRRQSICPVVAPIAHTQQTGMEISRPTRLFTSEPRKTRAGMPRQLSFDDYLNAMCWPLSM